MVTKTQEESRKTVLLIFSAQRIHLIKHGTKFTHFKYRKHTNKKGTDDIINKYRMTSTMMLEINLVERHTRRIKSNFLDYLTPWVLGVLC